MKNIAIIILVVFIIHGCDLSDDKVTPKRVAATKLTDQILIKGKHKNEVQEAIKFLKSKGESPDDFYLSKLKEGENGLIILPLWHKSAFGDSPQLGNPGSKSRNLYYDPKNKLVVKQLWWQ